MKKTVFVVVMLALVVGACSKKQTPPQGPAQTGSGVSEKGQTDVSREAKVFLDDYQKQSGELNTAANLADWKASNSGKAEDFKAKKDAELAVKKFHSDPQKYQKVQELLQSKDQLDPMDARALEVAELDFKGNQLPSELLQRMVELSNEIEQVFKTHRGQVGGQEYSNNDLLQMLSQQTDSAKRKEAWEALKQVGAEVGPKLVELAKVRNEAAKHLGYANYWDMEIRLQEHDPDQLLAIFAELEQLTNEPFAKMKEQLDSELAERFGIEPDQLMPWHYDNPFFQAAPPSAKVDLDEFYRDKKKEDIVEVARRFYADIGLPVDDIIARSDLYEREGKDQHAFSSNIDRAGDVRTLLNIKPTAEWMDTMLHEQGHAIYDASVDPSLPYNLRTQAHILTTEGVAMLFGAQAKNPTWMVACAGADQARVDEVKGAILEQRRREQLIFCRWALVMLNFEKALYEDPDQDVNKLWWDLVERYQHLKRPPGRDQADWAAKQHFTVVPVYYHNYMLGELFAAQLRHVLAEMVGHQGPMSELSFNGRKEFGTFMKEKVFSPGTSAPWPVFVERVTGEKLTPKYFAEEVQ